MLTTLKWIIIIAISIVIGLSCEIGGAEPNFEGIVIHHSATEQGTVESIRRYHVEERGWNDIGYHFVIYKDGSVHKGRNINIIGAHALGRNKDYIGVCLIGENAFTIPQKQNLGILLKSLAREYSIKSIQRHHELCPGKGLEGKFFTKNERSRK